jgi:hypothetical protein
MIIRTYGFDRVTDHQSRDEQDQCQQRAADTRHEMTLVISIADI